jgi:hypothetical protein
VTRGGRSDFWRSAQVGLGLARFGWVPWSLDLDRRTTVKVGGSACPVYFHVSATPHGCHTGASLWLPRGRKPGPEEIARELHDLAGDGVITARPDEKHVSLRRGIASVGELKRGRRSLTERLKLPLAKRATLIRALLGWLSANESLEWSGCSMVFRMERTFSAEGLRWRLFSDFFFFRGEGLYWNNFLGSPQADRRTYRRLEKTGFIGAVTESLKQMGFRVSYHPPHGVPFDQDFLTPAQILKKAPRLSAWNPPAP